MTKSKPVPETAPPDEAPDTVPADQPPTDAEQVPEVPPNAMHNPAHPLHHLRNT
jgi:hypothetical protein